MKNVNRISIKTVEELLQDAEFLQHEIYLHMESYKNDHPDLRATMNELIELIKELDL